VQSQGSLVGANRHRQNPTHAANVVTAEIETAKAPSKQFAENMRRSRKRHGLSQEDLAHACGLHRTEISLLERGDRDPRLSTVVRLARAMDCSASSLLEGVE
jgi:DNA-binding XRE family transcriptional regulator